LILVKFDFLKHTLNETDDTVEKSKKSIEKMLSKF